MTSGWPPSPSVEDEDAALAREHEHELAVVVPSTHATEDPPVKGSVDQYPIILDINDRPTSWNDSSAIESDREHSSSDESRGPPTPVAANGEQRFVLLEHETPKKVLHEEAPGLSRPKSISNLRTEDHPRGRPYVSPIHTDMGNNLDEMVTGRRKPLSPYLPGSKQPLDDSRTPKRLSGGPFASPQHVSSDEYHRARSTAPRTKLDDTQSMTDPDRTSDKRRHHSRRRRESGIRTARPSLEKLAPATFDKRSLSYSAAAPIASMLSSGLHTRQEPSEASHSRRSRTLRDSPYSSSAEEKSGRHRSKSRRRSKSRPQIDRKSTYDSPYTSSAEESATKSHRVYRVPITEGKLSRQSSTAQRERGPLNISDQQYSYGGGDHLPERLDNPKRRSDSRHHAVFDGRSYLEPSSTQLPKAVEDYLAKAFKINSKRSSFTPRGSPNASPFTSPPRSPPRTPRGNRSSKDYFDLASPVLQEAPRSRQPSSDDSPWNVSHPPTATTATATGVATSRAAPSLSRSSTTPIDTFSHGSSSNDLSSGQRSRWSSPVEEDAPRPISRAASFDIRDDRPVTRPSAFTSHEQRRPPRIPAVIAEGSSGTEYRPSSRGNSYIGLEPPQPITRAYSAAAEEVSRPSSVYRTMSSSQGQNSPIVERAARPLPSQRTSSSTFVTPTSAGSFSASPFSTFRQSSFIPVPVQGPPAVVPNREPAPTNLPPCPRSSPVAGCQDWFTVNQVSDINICPACMATLGSSRFRDIFVPSLPRPDQKIRCSMSRSWMRIAFIQAVRQRRTPQEMTQVFYDLTHLPESTRPCPGKEPETRKWYQLIDPYDKSIVPGFELCTHCVRNVDLVFPQLTGTFERTSSLLQERVCNLNTQSKRFLGYIDQLDKAASRFDNGKLRKPDVQDLAKYARRVAHIHDCPRDNMMFATDWHFMPDLPEFTICAECFEELVRPIIDKPIARDFCRRPKPLPPLSSSLPGSVGSSSALLPAGATSCQLYSARMRKVFQEAVRANDYPSLRQAAVQRHDAEVRCQTRHREMVQDRSGRDRKEEILKNVEVWRTWE